MSNNKILYQRACAVIPGGVNSPVRAFKGVDAHPIFFTRAKGAYLYDAENNAYVDYIGSWGPMIAGHAHPAILKVVQETIENGLSFGTPTPIEVEMAEKITELMPSIEMVRMVNSGTEATMSAIRLARGVTNRSKIIKFNGCYHGHSDGLLAKAGSGVLTLGIPDSAGVPESITQHTLIAEYNDLDGIEKFFQQFPQDIAAVIVEPVAGNMNCILPQPGFLQGLRELCDHYQSILIFDEVMTGFRVALGGAQARYAVVPDLTTLGKIIGGGLPVGAFGGRHDIMQHIAPLGPVYQAGTLSGNPVAMAAGLATLTLIQQDNFYETLEKNTSVLMQGLRDLAKQYHIGLLTQHVGGMFGIFFTEKPSINNFQDVKQCDIARFKQFFRLMLIEGVYLAPSAFEAGFVSSAHAETEITKTLAAAEKAFKSLK